MNWLRLATIVGGAAVAAAGALVPGLQALIPLGIGVAAYAARSPFDRSKEEVDK